MKEASRKSVETPAAYQTYHPPAKLAIQFRLMCACTSFGDHLQEEGKGPLVFYLHLENHGSPLSLVVGCDTSLS